MKHLFIAVLAFALSSCMSVESAVDACPSAGLVDGVFTEGRPPGGEVIPFEAGEKVGTRLWNLSGSRDGYLTCHYDDGITRLQKLPSEMRSCTLTRGGLLSCRSSI